MRRKTCSGARTRASVGVRRSLIGRRHSVSKSAYTPPCCSRTRYLSQPTQAAPIQHKLTQPATLPRVRKIEIAPAMRKQLSRTGRNRSSQCGARGRCTRPSIAGRVSGRRRPRRSPSRACRTSPGSAPPWEEEPTHPAGANKHRQGLRVSRPVWREAREKGRGAGGVSRGEESGWSHQDLAHAWNFAGTEALLQVWWMSLGMRLV